MMRRLLRALALLAGGLSLAAAADTVDICYNYGCQEQAAVEFSPTQLAALGEQLGRAADASSERVLLSQAIGRMYRIAGAQTPIWHDKGGNSEDDEVEGRMDCIDHSTTTTRFLELLEGKGWLHFHRVLPRQMRRRGLIFNHWTAAILDEDDEEFAVDSWFYDHGEGAAILPFEEWLAGHDPEIRHRVDEAIQEQMELQVNQ